MLFKEEKLLPPSWAKPKLADLFLDPKSEIVDGPFGSNLKASEYENAGVPIIRIQNVERFRFINKNIKYVTQDKADFLKRHTYKPGDLAITKLGDPLGKVCLMPESFPGGVIVADIVRARLSHQHVSKEFLVYLLNSDAVIRQFKEKTKGTTRARVNLSHIRNLEISLPPYSEQLKLVNKIEEIFSELDSGVESLNKAIKQLKTYRQAVLKAAFEGKLTEKWRKENIGKLTSPEKLIHQIEENRKLINPDKFKVTGRKEATSSSNKLTSTELYSLSKIPSLWQWTTVSQLADVSGGLTKNSKRNSLEMKIPYLRVANVYANQLKLSEIKVIGIEEKEIERVLLNKGDLLIVEGNGSVDQIGRVAIWDGSISPCAHQNHLIKARPDIAALGSYILNWLLSPMGRQEIKNVASSTSGLHTLSLSKISKLPIPLCSIEESIEIISEIESRLSIANQLEKDLEKNLRLSETTRQSILKRAFEGKLVPQDPKDEPAKELLKRIKAERDKAEAEQKSAKKSTRKPPKKDNGLKRTK